VRTAAFVLLLSLAALEAKAQTSQQPVHSAKETVVVLGSVEPVSLGDSSRTVVAIDTQEHALAFQDVEDYLRTDASVDIQQRAAAGVMADISLRGASFEQTLVLLNGLRMNNVETSHFNLDIPAPLIAIGGLNILHGTGSTLYGSDAIGGVTDFLTWKPTASTLRFRSGVGSFGENQQAFLGSYAGSRASEVLAGSRDFSDGFITDRDYRTAGASSESWISSGIGTTDLLLSGDDRVFGAAGFYGNYNSWERTKGWFASATQEFNSHTEVAFAYRRHSDIFLLQRDQPLGYKNQHIDDGFEGVVRDRREIAKDATLLWGLEENTDQIRSTNLGDHGRNRGAGYAEAEWRLRGHSSISAGLREELFSGGRWVSSPMIAGTIWLPHSLKLHEAAGYGFRIPTYLDLYYTDPTTIGNPNLKPESAWNFEAGLDWFPRDNLAWTTTVFDSRQRHTIDYTRTSAADHWQASNLPGLNFAGVETALDWRLTDHQQLKASWTLLVGAQDALHGLQSEYVFNYPTNNGRFEWTWISARGILIDSRLGVVQRFHADSYPVWDSSIARASGRIRPYLQMTNLSNTGYEEIIDVRMPGRGFVGGVEFLLSSSATHKRSAQ
jgi:iron complex outermembrane receptor protein